MSDDSQVKIMQSLGLDYNPAINSVLEFEKTIGNLNKQLADMKVRAIQGAKDTNNIFSSQFGNMRNSQILDQWGVPIRTIREEAIRASQPINEMNSNLGDTSNQLNNTGVAVARNTIKFYAWIRAAKEMRKTIKDVEFGMVEIQRVMTDSSFVFDDYRNKLLNLGVGYGQTFDNVQHIALRWTQSGYNVADSLKLTETSLLALNTAELNATQATEAMIGIMSQWQLKAEDMALVMDKINIVADRNAVTSQDLVDGLLRSSGAAKVMNLSMDETIGLLTVMREASGRTGKEVGNALNSILSYIQRPKSIEVLEDLGIQMFADSAKTNFRNVLDVFKDIASNWNTFSADIQDGFVKSADDANLFSEELSTALDMQEEWNDLQQRDISQATAGVYRRNYFIGMIERLADVQGVLNDMVDAEGYSLRENEKTMESLEKKMNSLKASTEALAVAVGDAGLTSALKSMAVATTKTFDGIVNLPKPMRDFLLASVSTVASVKAFSFAMEKLRIPLPDVNVLLRGLFNSTTTLSQGFNTAANAVAGFVSANAPLLILSASIGVLATVTNAVKKHREEQEKLISTTKENIKNYEEQTTGLKELSREYDALKSKEKDLTITYEEKARLRDVQVELVDLYGVAVSGIDAEGRAYADGTGAIKERIDTLEKLTAIEKERLETSVRASDTKNADVLKKNLDKRLEIEEKLLKVSKDIELYESVRANKRTIKLPGVNYVADASTDQGIAILKNHLDGFYRDKERLELSLGKANSAISDAIKDRRQLLIDDAVETVQGLSDNGAKISDSTRLFATELAKGLSQSTEDIFTLRDDLKKAINEIANSEFDDWVEKYNKALSAGDTKGIEEAKNEVMNLVEEFTKANPVVEKWALNIENGVKNGETISSTISDMVVNLEEVNKSFDSATSNIQSYNSILSELNSKQGLSSKSVQDIISKHNQLAPYLGEETELRKKLIKAIEDEEKAQRKAYRDMIEHSEDYFKAKIKGNADWVEKLGEFYTKDFENAKSLAKAKEILDTNLIDTLGKKWGKYYGVVAGSLQQTPEFKKLMDFHLMGDKSATAELKEVMSAVKEWNDVQKRFENLSLDLAGDSLGNVNVSDKKDKSKSDKYENKALDHALKLLEHRKKLSEESQDSIRAEIVELNRINSLYVKNEDERMAMLERIYSAEKRLRDRMFADSSKWISDKKALDELSVEEEIAAWERVAKAHGDGTEQKRQAELNLYKLRSQVMADSYSKEESMIKHLTKLGVLSVDEQIEKYRELYQVKTKDYKEEQARIENYFDLYKKRISEQQKVIKEAHDKNIEKIEKEAKAKKDMHQAEIEAINKELELLNRQEDEHGYEKRMADLREQLAYWQVRTSEDARKKVAELNKQIAEEERKHEVELQKQALTDRKKSLEDEVKAVDDNARNEREKLDKSYKQIEVAFDEHSIDMIALASTMSKGMFEEFEKNYLVPLENALRDGDYHSIGGIVDGINNYGQEALDKTFNSSNAQVYRLANQILDLKRQYEYGGDKSAADRAKSLYDNLARLNKQRADDLHSLNYQQAKDYVAKLPTMHSGGKTLSYGAVYMKPGELVFPPDLSTKLESLISVLYQRPISQSSSSLTDNRRETKIETLLNVENMYMEDDIDGEILSRELHRQLKGVY